jgi:proton-translocating NAD(P)+ transhydrogenase subunit alpha
MSSSSQKLIVGVIAERAQGERRVAMVPSDVRRLESKVTFLVEHGAGQAAGFADEAYALAGATPTNREALLAKAEVIVAVRFPADMDSWREGALLISLGSRDPALEAALAERRVTHLPLERMPRIARAQSMDVLSSQAAIAGYAAVLEGARSLDVMLPMLTTAAGGIKPARMIALGAGVAGLQAIATARRLGAITHGFDIREAAREQVESVGAKFIHPGTPLASADGKGGYASEQTAEEQERLRRALAPGLASMQLIITTAQVPGRRAPLLIDKLTLGALTPGTVIVDLAAESGGNCEATRPDEVVEVAGVRILGPTNLPSAVATDASRLFSGNLRALLEHLLGADGQLRLTTDDPITGPLLGNQAPFKTASLPPTIVA